MLVKGRVTQVLVLDRLHSRIWFVAFHLGSQFSHQALFCRYLCLELTLDCFGIRIKMNARTLA